MSLVNSASRAKAIDNQSALHERAQAFLGRADVLSTSIFDRVAAAPDASHYLLTPRAVVTPRNVEDIAQVFSFATTERETVTFRSGGTSLSGQASTDGLLVDTRKFFRSITILEEGRGVTVQPGVTVRQVNARLARYGRKLGPDPASEIACTIGGVIANNSSGMACGITQNTYRTLRSAVIVLPSGTVVDTSAPDAEEKLQEREPALWNTLHSVRASIVEDPQLVHEIARQYSIKNTMGYGLNSLVDHNAAVPMLLHLLVGSEGTLGFIAEATFDTVPLYSEAATTLLIFESLAEATNSLVQIIGTSPATVELMDAGSLRAALIDPESREALPRFTIVDHCALLVEYQAQTKDELSALSARAEALFERLQLSNQAVLSHDSSIRAALWHVRKGLYATVAGTRPPGTTALLEDVAVPVKELSRVCAGLTALFQRHGYNDAVIFGHAKDGNVHFLINEYFNDAANLERYRTFTEDMVELVLAAGGSLKAEHGTGRIMAPFVARQFGPVLYEKMLLIKKAFDPGGVLNPDAVLSKDADLHLRHLKSTPTVESEVDRCVECGYCEPVCPSKDLTTTPRQRIVISRAIAEAEQNGETELAKELRTGAQYGVVATCAVDGMCQTACPVLINTGDLVRRLRSEESAGPAKLGWNAAAKAWGPLTNVASVALTIAAATPPRFITTPNKLARKMFGEDVVPLWSEDLPQGGAGRVGGGDRSRADAVYFQACVGTMFGPAEGGAGVAVAFESLAVKAGVILFKPDGVEGLCCGTPWKSKGILEGYASMAQRTVDALWTASDEGRLPVVCDNSSCSEGLVLALQMAIENNPERRRLRIVDAVDFAVGQLLPKLRIEPAVRNLVVHPTCSSTRAGSNLNLLELASVVADQVSVPAEWNCCAFAGDRGMLHPELTKSATARESAEVGAGEYDSFASCNRTCEIGMTRATGRPYQHIIELVDRSATPIPVNVRPSSE